MKGKIMILGLTLALTLGETVAQTPYGWRGPTRSGQYPETGLLKQWPANGPQLLWETLDAGKGYSSPVIVDDRIYLTGMNEDETKEIFSAYSMDGKKIYEVVYGNPWDQTYPETRTTPAIDNGKAYVISGSGEIVCINTADGKIVWSVDGGKLYERMTGKWGTSECPLVFDDKIIYSPGGKQTTIVALNKENGQLIWKSEPLGEHATYVSPILITYNGKRKILGMTGKSVYGVDPETGKIDWTFKEWGRTPEEVANGMEAIATNTPLYKDGRIFVCNGYNMGSFMLQLNEDASDVSLLWRNNDLDTHHGGYVLVDGTIYGSNWINNNQGNWVAVDWATGATKYDTNWGGGKSKGSIVTADGMLYIYDERRGTVGLVKPNPAKFEVVSEFRITKGEGPHWAHPVLHDGVLYIRHGNAFMAYKVK